jgi:hypothetical protein
MAIDFTTDILPFYDTDVKTETEYQTPGDFDLPAFFGSLVLADVAINTGDEGSGYLANDVVTLSGGTLFSGGAAATAKVLTVDGGGGALTVAVVSGGHYTVQPADPISVTGGAGTGLKLVGTWAGFGEQRILTLVEVTRAYLAAVENNHEAKLFQEVLSRMMAAIRFGSPTWDSATLSGRAQRDALRFIAHHILATDI